MTLAARKLDHAAAGPATLPKVVCVESGHALVVHLAGQLDPRAIEFARTIARDPEHTVVVADIPPDGPIELWHAVAGRLGRRRGGYRLVLGRHSRDTAVMTGQWLAERLNCPVVVSDGDLVLGTGGTLFSSALKGRGWVRFRRSRPPEQDSCRFPTPPWTFAGAEKVWRLGPVSVVEPLPSGVWIRSADRVTEHDRRMLVSALPARQDTLTVVIGAPRARPLPLSEILRFARSAPTEIREKLRFVQYGSVDVLRSCAGQALADRLGAPVTWYAGLPMPDGSLRTVAPDGALTWRCLARELRYQPSTMTTARTMVPQLLSYDSPIPGAPELSPGVYWYTVDSVVEIVQSGLWLRSPTLPGNAAQVRAAPTDPYRAQILVDTTGHGSAPRMERLANDLLVMLDPAMRRMFRVLPVSVLPPVTAEPAAGVVVESSPGDWCESVDSEPAIDTVITTESIDRGTSEALAVLPSALERSEDRTLVIAAPSAGTEKVRPLAPQARSLVAQSPVIGTGAGPGEECDERTGAAATAAEPAVDAPLPVRPRLESSVPDADSAPAPALPPPPALAESAPVPAPSSAVERQRHVASSPSRPRVQPVPASAACAVPPERGLAEERGWLRKTLSSDYDIAASTVSRMLSEVPGLRASVNADEVLADLVAVRLYLTGDVGRLDAAVRSAAAGPHVPLARLVTSGLRRLPSYRGSTQLWATAGQPDLDWYRDRVVVSEWAFLAASTSGRTARPGELEFRIWSLTARRTQLVQPDLANQVLFAPGTSFKVLEVRDEPTPSVLLRELSSAEIDVDGQVKTGRGMFDDLALNGLDQAAQIWAESVDTGGSWPVASAPPGLLPTTMEGTNA